MRKKATAWIPVIAIVAAFGIFKALQPTRFGTVGGIQVLFQQTLMETILACGMYFLLETGIFDMTLGVNVLVSSLVGCRLSEICGVPGLLVGSIVTGLAISAISGQLMTRIKINPMIISVGLIIIYEALTNMLVGGALALRIDDRFRVFGTAPVNIFISVAVILVSAGLSSFTKFGLYVNAMSSNLAVAQNMGISVRKYQTLAFVYAGVCAGLMGIVNICYTTSASAASGLSSTATIFTPLMACMFAGAFKKYMNPILALFLGGLCMNIIETGLLSNGLESSLQNIVVGVMLLVLVRSSKKTHKYDVSK